MKTGDDRRFAFPGAPVLQRDLAAAGFFPLESERNDAAGADGIVRITRLGGKQLDELLIIALYFPAVACGRVLRQAYLDGFARMNIQRSIIIFFNE